MTQVQERQLDLAVGVADGRTYWSKTQRVSPGTTLSELLVRPELDFQVEKAPLQYGIDKGDQIGGEEYEPNMDWRPTGDFVGTVRVNPDGSTFMLGAVSPRYSVVQHGEALEVCEYIAGKSGAEYESVGTADGGRGVWLTMKLPTEDGRPLRIAGDLVHPYMLFSTRHDGGGAVAIINLPTRDACTNAIPIGSPAHQRIRHIGNTKDKLKAAEEALKRHRSYMAEFARLADQLALKRATPRELASWVDAMYPINRENLGDRAVSSREEARLMVEHLTNHAENLAGHHGTAWAFVNAVAEYTDWGSRRRRNQMGPLLGTRETTIKNRAVKIVLDSMN